MATSSKRKNKKKLKTSRERSLLRTRGERLATARGLMGLTQMSLAKAIGVSAFSVSGWETGKYGGLSMKGAREVVKLASKRRVRCSLDWLVHGLGTEPVVNEISIKKLSRKGVCIENGEELFITQELGAFFSIFESMAETAVLRIEDDAMLPYFEPNDYVAGCKRTGQAIASLIGKVCIVEIPGKEDGILRRLKTGSQSDKYTLICDNVQATKVTDPVLYDVTITSAAPVIRHYKVDGTVDLRKMKWQEEAEAVDSEASLK